MEPKAQKMIDEIMYETNEKISAIVNEIRDIRFSTMDEKEKQKKCDHLREEFERVMVEEEKKIKEVMNKTHEDK
jgi:hypothetical protein